MSRRPHKKSKNGCLQCKQRHVKCDETHPSCVNCSTGELPCSFALNAVTRSRSTPKNDIASLHGERSPLTDSNSTSSASVEPQRDARLRREALYLNGDGAPLNLTHLALFYHFISETYKTYGYNHEEIDIRKIFARYAFTYPFLMYEVLALTALQLSITEPARASFYQQQSAELLAQALACFQDVSQNLNAETICPAFLFSGLIGLHFFCDTFNQSPSTDLDTFLDQLVHSIKVLRGVRAVIGPWWPVLLESELRPLIDIAEPPEGLPISDESIEQFEALRRMVRESQNMSVGDREAYESAIDQLVFVHRLELVHNSEHQYLDSRRAMAWPITVSAEYTELLSQRKPEALVILAYYSVRLDKCSNLWAIGTAGKVLLSAVDAYLAPEWRKWLAWPAARILTLHTST